MIRKSTRPILLFLFLLFLLSCNLYAQQDRSAIIGKIEVQGNSTTGKEIIILNSGLRPGKKILIEDIQLAIRQIWRLGTFKDIKIFQTGQTGSSMDMLIVVDEYPRLNEISITGNDGIKREDIDKKLDFYKGGIINNKKVRNKISDIKKLYSKEGYILADIQYEIQPTDTTGRVNISFAINEGEKVQIKKILFEGNDNIPEKNLRKQLEETKQKGFLKGGDFKEDEYENDKILVAEYYKKEGYRDARVVGDSIWYSPEKKWMFIKIKVNEGNQYYFGDITISGNHNINEEALLTSLKFQKGDIYNSEKFTESTGALANEYYKQGYIFAQINPFEIPVSRDTVNVNIEIVEMNQVSVNKILIKGNTTTKDKVIRRELKVYPGQMFNSELLELSQRQVWILNYFSNVVPNVQPVDNSKVDLVFSVEEKSTQTANMSAGYSQRDGMIGSVGVSMNNLFGNGQRFSLNWSFGSIYRNFQISFTEPWLLDTPTLAGFSVFDTKRGGEWYGYDHETRGGSIQLGRRFNWPDMFFRGDWIFEVSRNEISNIRDDVDLREYLLGINLSNHVGIKQIFSRDSRDRPEFATRGSVFMLSTEFSGGLLGGDEDFYKHEFSLEWYTPAFWKFVLYQNFEFGYMNGWKADSYIPPYDKFYLGGSALSIGTPLRGYDERVVGPQSISASPWSLGGNTLLKYSVEFRFPIIPNPTMFGLLFAEGGNTWNSLNSMDPFDLKRSVGVGLRIFMPMLGIIGFDVAYGFDKIDGINNKTGWKPHFQFGRGF